MAGKKIDFEAVISKLGLSAAAKKELQSALGSSIAGNVQREVNKINFTKANDQVKLFKKQLQDTINQLKSLQGFQNNVDKILNPRNAREALQANVRFIELGLKTKKEELRVAIQGAKEELRVQERITKEFERQRSLTGRTIRGFDSGQRKISNLQTRQASQNDSRRVRELLDSDDTDAARRRLAASSKLVEKQNAAAQRQALKNIAANERDAAKAAAEHERALLRQAKAFDANRFSAAKFGEQVGLATKRFAAYLVGTTGLFAVIAAFGSATQEALKFEKSQTRLSQILNVNRKGVAGIGASALQASKATGTSSSEIQSGLDILAQAGFQNPKQLATVAKVFAKVPLSATFGSIQETSEGLIAVFQQFNKTLDDQTDIFDLLNRVAADYAVEVKDIFEGVKRGGSSFAAAGGNLKEFVELFSLLRSETRLSAETLGTFFKTVTFRLFSKKNESILKALGIDAPDISGRLFQLASAFKNLFGQNISGNPRALQLLEQIVGLGRGGAGGTGGLIALINAINKDNGKFQKTLSGISGSFDRDTAKRLDDIATSFNRIQASINSVFSEVIQSEGLRSFFKIIADGASSLASLAAKFKEIIPLLLAFAGIKAAGSLLTIGGTAGRKLGLFGGQQKLALAEQLFPILTSEGGVDLNAGPRSRFLRFRPFSAVTNNFSSLGAFGNTGIEQRISNNPQVQNLLSSSRIVAASQAEDRLRSVAQASIRKQRLLSLGRAGLGGLAISGLLAGFAGNNLASNAEQNIQTHGLTRENIGDLALGQGLSAGGSLTTAGIVGGASIGGPIGAIIGGLAGLAFGLYTYNKEIGRLTKELEDKEFKANLSPLQKLLENKEQRERISPELRKALSIGGINNAAKVLGEQTNNLSGKSITLTSFKRAGEVGLGPASEINQDITRSQVFDEKFRIDVLKNAVDKILEIPTEDLKKREKFLSIQEAQGRLESAVIDYQNKITDLFDEESDFIKNFETRIGKITSRSNAPSSLGASATSFVPNIPTDQLVKVFRNGALSNLLSSRVNLAEQSVKVITEEFKKPEIRGRIRDIASGNAGATDISSIGGRFAGTVLNDLGGKLGINIKDVLGALDKEGIRGLQKIIDDKLNPELELYARVLKTSAEAFNTQETNLNDLNRSLIDAKNTIDGFNNQINNIRNQSAFTQLQSGVTAGQISNVGANAAQRALTSGRINFLQQNASDGGVGLIARQLLKQRLDELNRVGPTNTEGLQLETLNKIGATTRRFDAALNDATRSTELLAEAASLAEDNLNKSAQAVAETKGFFAQAGQNPLNVPLTANGDLNKAIKLIAQIGGRSQNGFLGAITGDLGGVLTGLNRGGLNNGQIGNVAQILQQFGPLPLDVLFGPGRGGSISGGEAAGGLFSAIGARNIAQVVSGATGEKTDDVQGRILKFFENQVKQLEDDKKTAKDLREKQIAAFTTLQEVQELQKQFLLKRDEFEKNNRDALLESMDKLISRQTDSYDELSKALREFNDAVDNFGTITSNGGSPLQIQSSLDVNINVNINEQLLRNFGQKILDLSAKAVENAINNYNLQGNNIQITSPNIDTAINGQ